MSLTLENYSKGFLMDEELMGGITESPEAPGTFVAFVLRHTTGEYLGYQSFTDLNEALATLNRVERPWMYEKTNGCGGCGEGGGCAGGQCGKGACSKGACPTSP